MKDGNWLEGNGLSGVIFAYHWKREKIVYSIYQQCSEKIMNKTKIYIFNSHRKSRENILTRSIYRKDSLIGSKKIVYIL